MKRTVSASKSRNPQALVAISTALVTFGIGLATVISAMLQASPSSPTTLQRMATLQAAGTANVGLQATVSALQTQVAATPQVSRPGSVSIQLQSVNDRVNSVEASVALLEGAILQDPNHAVSLPILRNDVENQKELNNSRFLAAEQSIDRLYNIVVSVTVVIGLAFLGLAATNLLGKRRGG